jgi:predicted porin
VTVGREYGPIAAVAGASDTLGQGFYGSNLAAFGTNRLTRRLSNSVNYQSNALSGFTLRAAYGAGERSVDPSGDVTGVSLEYANAGLYIGAGYQNVERLTTGDDKEYNAGIGYKFGDFEVRAGYMAADPETGVLPSAKYEQKNAGVSYGFGANRVFLNYQQQELATGAEGKAVTVAYTYTLSKRTNVYASYAKLRNNNNGVFSLTSPSGTIALPATAFGSDPQVYNVGVRHSF